MRPTIFEIPLGGGRVLPLHSYGLMIAVGFLFAVWIARVEFRRRRLPDVANDLGVCILLCGLFGARLFYYVQFYSQRFAGESFLEFFKIWRGGLVFYGGAVGGLVGGALYARWKKLPLLDCLDVVGVGAPVAMAFGRLGCFLNGCCYGALCDPSSPLAVTFPPGSLAQSGQWERGLVPSASSPALPLHPAQLYQAAHDFVLFGLLLWYVRRPRSVRGAALPLAVFLYGVGRFAIECFRGDHVLTATGLTVSQNVAAGSAAVALALIAAFYLRGGRGSSAGVAAARG
ncbi:MAG: prolipoprotein diacylglyceryl transferase [Planctomycetota bacterium]